MSGENYLKAAYSYLYIRDFQQAAEAFRRAIESDPDNPSHYFHASITALRNECHELALEWAETAVRLEPDNTLFQEHLNVVQSSIRTKAAQFAILEGEEQVAAALFQEALQLDPLNEEAATGLKMLQTPMTAISNPTDVV